MKIMSREKVTKKCKYFVILHYIRHSLCVNVARWDKDAERYTRRLLPSCLRQSTFLSEEGLRTVEDACPYNLSRLR